MPATYFKGLDAQSDRGIGAGTGTASPEMQGWYAHTLSCMKRRAVHVSIALVYVCMRILLPRNDTDFLSQSSHLWLSGSRVRSWSHEPYSARALQLGWFHVC